GIDKAPLRTLRHDSSRLEFPRRASHSGEGRSVGGNQSAPPTIGNRRRVFPWRETMKTLITGAAGFVGSAVLRQLLAAGHDVRALVRPNSDRRNLIGLRVEIVNGDVTDRQSLDRAMKGCSTLFHVAGDYRLWLLKPGEMYETNVI